MYNKLLAHGIMKARKFQDLQDESVSWRLRRADDVLLI